jgi:hypothetical protein
LKSVTALATLTVGLLTLALSTSALGQSAPAKNWTPPAYKIYAQALADETMAKHPGPSALLGHRYTVAAARAQPAGSLSGMQPSASRTSPSDQT